MLDHLDRHPLALCFVGMGIGKTAACLATIARLIKNKQSKGALIVAPLRVINLTWPMECQGFNEFKGLRVANLRTDMGRRMFILGAADLYLINYEMLCSREITVKKPRPPTPEEIEMLALGIVPPFCIIKAKDVFNEDEVKLFKNYQVSDRLKPLLHKNPQWLTFYDPKQKVSPGFVQQFLERLGDKKPPFDILILDESTKVKEVSHKGATRLRRWLYPTPDENGKPRAPRVPRRWALTGTPAPNSLLDLFGQVRLVDNGKRLGPSMDHFKQLHFEPSGYQGYKFKARDGAKEIIYDRISDITLTLRSSEWLDIPDTVVEDIETPLPPDLHKRYQQFERDLVLRIKQDKEITASTAAALVSKLLQFTSGSIYDENKVWHDIHDIKFDALRKLLKEHKTVLVAYNFQHEAARLRKAFPEAEFFADAKNGGSQTELLRRWNAGKIKMLVAHPQSVGHGLNLQHGGNVIVWLTLTYSRENYEQMIARLARRGQDEVVRVYRIMCPGTVDDAVATAILEKQETENHLLSALMMLESYRKNGSEPLKMAAVRYLDPDLI